MSTTAEITLDGTALRELGASFRGQLIRPGDGSYEEHRKIWNGSIDRRPALIARCAGAADVIAALRLAKRGDLQVAIRSGGHSFPGQSICDGGLVIDLSLMRGSAWIRRPAPPGLRRGRSGATSITRPRHSDSRQRAGSSRTPGWQDSSGRRHRVAPAQARTDDRPTDRRGPHHR